MLEFTHPVGFNTIHGDYNISTQFCMPTGAQANSSKPTLQILTHGIAFDRTYWDLAYNNFNYSCKFRIQDVTRAMVLIES